MKSNLTQRIISFFFEIDPNFSKEQKKKSLSAYVKMTLLLTLTTPFWIWPLLFAVIIRIVEAEQAGGISFTTYLAILPSLYAYGSLLKDFLRLQKQRVRGNFKVPSLFEFIKQDSLDFLKLFAGQILIIVLSNFNGYTLVESISLQIFYFFAHILIYLYALILKDMPVNQKMRNLWGRKNN